MGFIAFMISVHACAEEPHDWIKRRRLPPLTCLEVGRYAQSPLLKPTSAIPTTASSLFWVLASPLTMTANRWLLTWIVLTEGIHETRVLSRLPGRVSSRSAHDIPEQRFAGCSYRVVRRCIPCVIIGASYRYVLVYRKSLDTWGYSWRCS